MLHVLQDIIIRGGNFDDEREEREVSYKSRLALSEACARLCAHLYIERIPLLVQMEEMLPTINALGETASDLTRVLQSAVGNYKNYFVAKASEIKIQIFLTSLYLHKARHVT